MSRKKKVQAKRSFYRGKPTKEFQEYLIHLDRKELFERGKLGSYYYDDYEDCYYYYIHKPNPIKYIPLITCNLPIGKGLVFELPKYRKLLKDLKEMVVEL